VSGLQAPEHEATLSTRLEEQDQFLLHDAREIRRVLNALIEKRSLVTVHLAPRNRMFPSALVSLDGDGQRLVVDGSRDAAINQAMDQANHVTCVTMLDRVPIQFRLNRLQRIDPDGKVAYRAPLPATLLYLQRRESHRLQVPVAEPVMCCVSVPGGQPDAGSESTLEDLRILDLSVGGCSVSLPRDCPLFRLGGEMHCSLHLPEASPIALRLVVRSRFDPPVQDTARTPRAGCAFVGLPAGAENTIQRYIFRIERNRKARERGDA